MLLLFGISGAPRTLSLGDSPLMTLEGLLFGFPESESAYLLGISESYGAEGALSCTLESH